MDKITGMNDFIMKKSERVIEQYKERGWDFAKYEVTGGIEALSTNEPEEYWYMDMWFTTKNPSSHTDENVLHLVFVDIFQSFSFISEDHVAKVGMKVDELYLLLKGYMSMEDLADYLKPNE